MISDREMFDYFVQRIKEELFTHPVITDNSYCKWFADADLTKDDVNKTNNGIYIINF